MKHKLILIALISSFVLNPVSVVAKETDTKETDTKPRDISGVIELKPGSKQERERIIAIVQSLLARAELEDWENPSGNPTKKALRNQIKSFMQTYVEQLERKGSNLSGRQRKQFYKHIQDLASRVEVQREKELHYGPHAMLYSPADFPTHSVNDFLDKMARAVSLLTIAIEKHQVDRPKDMAALSALGVRLLAESYLSAGATQEAGRFGSLESAILWSTVFLISFSVHSWADDVLPHAWAGISEWWSDGHPYDALAKLPTWAEDNLQTSAGRAFVTVMPTALGASYYILKRNWKRNRRAMRAIPPLMAHFWHQVDCHLEALSADSSSKPVEERVWDAFLLQGAIADSAVPASECVELLGSYLDVSNGNGNNSDLRNWTPSYETSIRYERLGK